MQKIFIITSNNNSNDNYKLAEYISETYGLDIANNFTTMEPARHFVKFSSDEVVLAYKNNALLYSFSKEDNHIGITMDEFYNKDVFCMNIDGFNNIAENRLENVLVIWLDTPTTHIDSFTSYTIRQLQQTLESVTYMYFNEPFETICEIVGNYIQCEDEEIRKQIILDNQ